MGPPNARSAARRSLLFTFSALASAQMAVAQCGRSWQDFHAASGVQGPVHAACAWDPDGAGPQPELVVLGGSFQRAGEVAASNIAAHDLSSHGFRSFDVGLNGLVRALAVLPNGDLVAAGSFTATGSLAVNRVVRWSGSAWQSIGSGINGNVFALSVLQSGDLVAAGDFTQAGGQPTGPVARFDGSDWVPIGAGLSGGAVLALATMPNGDLIAAGQFTASTPSGVANRIAAFDGSSWRTLGTGMDGDVRSLLVLASGELVAGGGFFMAGGAITPGVARWNGSSWSGYGAGPGNGANALVQLNSGYLVAGGGNGLEYWTGATWTTFGAVSGPPTSPVVRTLTKLSSGPILAGGDFRRMRPGVVNNVALWGGVWRPLGLDFDDQVTCVAPLDGAQFACGGQFRSVGGRPRNFIARWDGAAWQSFGSGMDGYVRAILRLPNGDLVAAGEFTTAGGVACSRIARWNGSAWQPFGSGMNGAVVVLALLPNGDLVAGGAFTTAGNVAANRIARWNGSTWQPFGSGWNAVVAALAVLPNGDLVAGGYWSGSGVAIGARWDGATWQSLGAHQFDSISCLATMPNGDLVAGGAANSSGARIARWTGASWVTLGTMPGFVRDLDVLPNGDLLATGEFATISGQPVRSCARWTGAGWQTFVSSPDLSLQTATLLPDGDVLLSTTFPWSGNAPSSIFARAVAACPATATAFGQPCAGSAGPLVASVESLPWVGSTCATRAAGFAPTAIGFVATGLTSPNTPLLSFHPVGVPGCDLLSSTEAVQLVLPTAGSAPYRFALPNSSAFAGQRLYQQFVQLDFDASGALTSLSGSNGLELVVGVL